MDLAALLTAIDERAATQPEKIALRETTGQTLTYAALAARVRRCAAGLRARGLAPGDQLLFMIRPGSDAITLILGTLRAGGVLVATDPTVGEALFSARIARLRPRWLMAESRLLALAASAPVRRLLAWRGLALPDLPGLLRQSGVRIVYSGRWLPGVPRSALSATALAADGTDSAPGSGDEDDPAVIVFTSGTTGAPRAVVHSAASIAATMMIVAGHLALAPDDVVYTSEMHLIIPALLAGTEVVLPRERDDNPARFLAHLRRYRATHAFAVPSSLDRLAATALRQQTTLGPPLRALLLGSAPVTRGLLARCQEVVVPPTELWCIYAQTEMLPVSVVTMTEKLAYDGPGNLVGAPFPGITARLAGDGELLLRGPNRCRGYLGAPPLDEVATGDLATIDAAGRIVLLGRKKEMIIRRGYNIYPALLEETIGQIPGVRACALVGLPDAITADERVVLAIEPEDGEVMDDLVRRVLRALVAGPHSIAREALPDQIIVARLPRAGRSQKVDRSALAALARARAR